MGWFVIVECLVVYVGEKNERVVDDVLNTSITVTFSLCVCFLYHPPNELHVSLQSLFLTIPQTCSTSNEDVLFDKPIVIL